MRVDEVSARIEAQVPSLNARVEGLAELSLLMAANEVPQVTPCAFVIPLGLDGSEQLDATSVHSQIVTEQVGVIVVVDYAGVNHGAEALPELSQLIDELVRAIAGWTPDEATTNFALRRGRLLDSRQGSVFYQLDFSIQSLLRI